MPRVWENNLIAGWLFATVCVVRANCYALNKAGDDRVASPCFGCLPLNFSPSELGPQKAEII